MDPPQKEKVDMTQKFRGFVVFAEMRTGSNLLEATLNSVKRVTCFGEAFNPYLMGWPGKDEMKGITKAERDADPLRLLYALLDKPNHLPGFRYFHDHDPRVFDAIIDDPTVAKIILTRNPVDSYVSMVQARATNQWKLNETQTAIPATVRFDAAKFHEMTGRIEEFRLTIQRRLQASGQTGFWLGYEDLRDTGVMTGLLHWLGRTELEHVPPATDLVPQNPQELSEKVSNFDEMQAELAKLDPFMLQRIPNFEPRRGPAVPSFHAAEAGAGVLFMPVRGGPTQPVLKWLRQMGEVQGDFTQNTLRQWKRGHTGHRSFTVLRHPLPRAWAAFEQLLSGSNSDLRRLLCDVHRVPLPPDSDIPALTQDRKVELFANFLEFLRRAVSGQTTLAVQAGWATQSEVLAGFSRLGQPDMILREADLARDLGWLATSAGVTDAAVPPAAEPLPAFLDSAELRQSAKKAYLRDYLAFGFADQP